MFAPFALFGLWLLWYCFMGTMTMVNPTIVVARVTEKVTFDDEGSAICKLRYVYEFGGQQYKGEDSVRSEVYDAAVIGQTEPIVIWSQLPGLYSALNPGRSNSLTNIGFYFAVMLVWNVLWITAMCCMWHEAMSEPARVV